MRKTKFLWLLFLLIFMGIASNASALIYSGVATINTLNRMGFDFIDQVACTTTTAYPTCYTHFAIYGGGPRTDLEASGGYAVKMGQVNLDSLKTAPADSVFAKSSLWIDQIPFDTLSFRVGCSYWIKTGPDAAWGNTVLYAKIRILSFPIMDSVKPETAMTFLYALDPTGGKKAITSGLDTFYLPYYPTGVLPPGTSQAHKTIAFSSPGQQVFKVVGDRFILPKDLEGISGYLSVFSLAGRRLERVAFDGKSKEINLSGAGRAASGAVVVRVER